jgi:methylated-DNA-[protein]-cysteine S-methyltransferase
MSLTTLLHATPVGVLTLIASDRGLRAVLWEGDSPERAGLDTVTTSPSRDAGASAGKTLREAATQIDEYFASDRRSFELQLDLEGTDFQLAAWQALADIPFGETRSYAQQAEAIGRPTAVRAVGAANGRNPISIVLPCHRVVGANGSLTGFAGGIDVKRRLLDHELGTPSLFHD